MLKKGTREKYPFCMGNSSQRLMGGAWCLWNTEFMFLSAVLPFVLEWGDFLPVCRSGIMSAHARHPEDALVTWDCIISGGICSFKVWFLRTWHPCYNWELKRGHHALGFWHGHICNPQCSKVMPPRCIQSSNTDLTYFNKSFLITLWEMLINYQK